MYYVATTRPKYNEKEGTRRRINLHKVCFLYACSRWKSIRTWLEYNSADLTMIMLSAKTNYLWAKIGSTPMAEFLLLMFFCCMLQLFCTVSARQSLDLTFGSHCDQRISNGHPQSCARPTGDLFYYTSLLIIVVKHMMFASVLLILFLAYILECMDKYRVQKVWIICF